MPLRIRQIVLAARELEPVVAQVQNVLGVRVCYRDPEVRKFGLQNALFALNGPHGGQFLEIVSPIQDDTTAGRHLAKHGDSGYMLILQTDDLVRDRQRLNQMRVRIVWEANHADVSAVHLHPKDIGGAIVSLDQPVPPESWRWAGPNWQRHVTSTAKQQVTGVTLVTHDPAQLSRRWADVLATQTPHEAHGGYRIDVTDASLGFEKADARSEVIREFQFAVSDPKAALFAARTVGVPVDGNVATICGTRFRFVA